MKELAEKLEHAKNAVRFCLEHANGNVDMKGLVYWAGEVERLRQEIIQKL